MAEIQYLDLPGIFAAGSQITANQQRNKLLDLQMQEATRKTESQNRLRDLIATLPQDQQIYATMAPDEFAKARVKQMFPDAKDRYHVSDGVVFDLQGDGGPKVALQGPRKPPEGMQYNDAGQLVAIPGYVAMRSQIAAAGREAPVTWSTFTDPATGKTYQRSSRGQLAEMPGAGGEPMVEVYDQSSPTGTRHVPRSQAAGQPGAPSSGLAVTTNPDGSVSLVQGRGIGGGDKPMTEGAARAGGFATRMVEAERRIEALPSEFNPTAFGEQAANLPVVGNKLASNEYQLYRQAAEDWIRAKLRKESGAVIGADEMEAEFRNYFPQFGDKPPVIAQKRLARETATKSIIGESQGGYGKISGAQPQAGQGQKPTPPAVAAGLPSLPPGFQIVE